jgi:hypothetical protein
VVMFERFMPFHSYRKAHTARACRYDGKPRSAEVFGPDLRVHAGVRTPTVRAVGLRGGRHPGRGDHGGEVAMIVHAERLRMSQGIRKLAATG